MAYATHTTWKDRPGAVAGVIAVHAALGYALITSYVGKIWLLRSAGLGASGAPDAFA